MSQICMSAPHNLPSPRPPHLTGCLHLDPKLKMYFIIPPHRPRPACRCQATKAGTAPGPCLCTTRGPVWIGCASFPGLSTSLRLPGRQSGPCRRHLSPSVSPPRCPSFGRSVATFLPAEKPHLWLPSAMERKSKLLTSGRARPCGSWSRSDLQSPGSPCSLATPDARPPEPSSVP